MPFQPVIASEIFALRPDFSALSLLVTNGTNRPSDEGSARLLTEAISGLGSAPWAADHFESWRETYRAFGANPKRTPCSAEALHKRALRDGQIRAANAVVNLYNAVSLRFAIPVGGEDAGSYVSAPTLCRATGSEPFQTMADGAPKTETPDPGEVIWCDEAGVTCRRWNWRQGVRTQLTEQSRDMWFVLERLAPMPIEALLDAAAMLAQGLRALAPSADLQARLFDSDDPQGRPVAPVI